MHVILFQLQSKYWGSRRPSVSPEFQRWLRRFPIPDEVYKRYEAILMKQMTGTTTDPKKVEKSTVIAEWLQKKAKQYTTYFESKSCRGVTAALAVKLYGKHLKQCFKTK